MTTEICKCEWTDMGSVALKVPVMTRREPTCLNHGDGSEWWRRTQEHAASLGREVPR